MSLCVVPDRLAVPRHVGDGRVVFADHEADIADRVRNGDPTLGWEGDPDLKLVRNMVEGRWELWRTNPATGGDTLVAVRAGVRFPGNDLIVALIAADSRRHDRAAQIEAAQAAEAVRAENDWRDRNEALADKFAHALGKDLDLPAPDGRVYALGGPDEPR